ncbi:hypothetical protein B0O99DRAFT_249102 [Bisporella sp. PMI_857]|nr:hypothetical protein B0O99DRAFT_249102 [Bisporella sp. PMI_857]
MVGLRMSEYLVINYQLDQPSRLILSLPSAICLRLLGGLAQHGLVPCSDKSNIGKRSTRPAVAQQLCMVSSPNINARNKMRTVLNSQTCYEPGCTPRQKGTLNPKAKIALLKRIRAPILGFQTPTHLPSCPIRKCSWDRGGDAAVHQKNQISLIAHYCTVVAI